MYFLRLRGYFGRWLPPWGLIRRDLLRRTFLGTQGAATYLSAADTFQILVLNAKMMAGCPLANPFSYRRAHAPEMCVRSSGEGSSCQTQPAATRGVLSPIFRLLADHRAGAGTYAPGVLNSRRAVSLTARTDGSRRAEEVFRSAREV